MRVKALGIIAAVALAGAASLAGSLSAQEEPGVERRVRVLALGQGSYLGVYISDITGEDVQRLGLREERGVRITGVAEDGPAQVAGLQEDDVIVTWNGDRIEGEPSCGGSSRRRPRVARQLSASSAMGPSGPWPSSSGTVAELGAPSPGTPMTRCTCASNWRRVVSGSVTCGSTSAKCRT